jgi:hypothetical protein
LLSGTPKYSRIFLWQVWCFQNAGRPIALDAVRLIERCAAIRDFECMAE